MRIQAGYRAQARNRVIKYILIFAFGVLAAATILFFAGEKLLDDGWYYIPGRATTVALILCMLWQGALIIGVCLLPKRLKMLFGNRVKNIIMIFAVIAVIFLVLFLAWHWLLYSLKFDEKVEQYDEHIALYVNNTFVRPKYRVLYYRYEENWLLMRTLSDDELEESILKYGDPDDYYNY